MAAGGEQVVNCSDLEKLSDRELDALCAQDVMGWTMHPQRERFPDRGWPQDADATCMRQFRGGISVPKYSTDPAASRDLRRKMEERGWAWEVRGGHGKFFSAFHWKKDWDSEIYTIHHFRSDNEERTVAIAALLAVGGGE